MTIRLFVFFCIDLDSITVMASYSDVVVLRHPEPGAVGVLIFSTILANFGTIFLMPRPFSRTVSC